MRLFVINLARRMERMAFMERQFAAVSLDFERIDAIDGEKLSEEDRGMAVNDFRWWCAQGYKARAGEIGCALSHRLALARIVDEGLPCACIMEDDVTLGEGFCHALETAERFLAMQAVPRVVLLTPCGATKGRAAEKDGFVRIPWASSTGCYVVNQEAAKRLLAVTLPITSTIDDWRRWSEKGRFALYAFYPSACSQVPYGSESFDSPFASDTRNRNTVFVSDMKPVARIVHKGLRLVGRTLDKLLP